MDSLFNLALLSGDHWLFGYLAFKASKISDIREKAFVAGEQQVISNLRGYFDQNPEHYKSYQKWRKQKDSVPNQK